MKTWRAVRNQRGITLIAVVMVVLAIGLIAYFAGAIAVKLQEIGKERNTVNRMQVVRDALRQYYRAHQDLPVPESGNRIPVTTLNLDQKYRVDAWGQYFYYFECRDTSLTPSRTTINALTVDGTPYLGGVLISGGPNQTQESTPSVITCSVNPAAPVVFTKSGDDLVAGINLSDKAQDIALEEMTVVREKLWAYACAKGPGTPIPTPHDSGDPGQYDFHDFLNEYGLSDQYQSDPWLVDYVVYSGGILSSGPDEQEATTNDNIVLGKLADPCANGQAAPPLPVESWGFNEGSGPTAGGGTGSLGSIGTLSGDANWSVETPNGSNSAVAFGGTNGFVQINSSPLLNLGPTELSISLWVKVNDSNTSIQPILRKWLSSDGGYGSYTIHRTAGNKIMGSVQNRTLGQYPAWETTVSLDIGYWHHVLFTYLKDRDGDGDAGPEDGKLYLNGLLVNAAHTPNGYNDQFTVEYCDQSFCNLYLGRQAASGWSQYFRGILDQVELFNVMLTDDDAKTLYYASTVARYLFHGNAIDASWRHNNGTFYGSTPPANRFVADRNGVASRAATFNGTDDWMDLGTDGSLNFRANPGGSVVAGGFTIMAWIKSVDQHGPILSFRRNIDGGAVIDFAVGFDGHNCPNPAPDAGRIMGLVRNDNEETAGYAQITGAFVNDGLTFHHVALSRGPGSSTELFRDGVSQGTGSGTAADYRITTNLRALGSERYWVTLTPWCTGWVAPRQEWWFSGVIDDAVIFPRNLSIKEIQAFYNNLL